jgi:hypothetical protein
MMLPYEEDARQDVRAACPNELAESRELLQLALDMLGRDGSDRLRISHARNPGVGDAARSLALGLYAKACKQFRAIMLTGEAGLGGEMAVLTRALFETALALELLLRERVALKQGGKAFDPDPSKPLTTDFRALLYGARVALRAEKQFNEWSARPELRESLALLGDPAQIAAQAAAARAAVGENWWKCLRKGQAGLSVKDLADSLGVTPYYVLAYGDQSEVIHAGDALQHFDVDDGGASGSLDLAPSSADVGGRLRLACLVFLGCLASLNNRLHFGPAFDSAIDAFATRLGVPQS